MRFAWLETLLPRAVLSPRTELGWLLFFLLFPLAYVGGVMLETHQESPAAMMGYEDRAASIRAAQLFAESKGFSVTGWHQYVVTNSNDKLLAYYQNTKSPAVAEAISIAPGQEVQVLFRSPDQSHEFRTYLSLTGQITGYEFGKSTSGKNVLSGNIGNIKINSDSTHSDDDPASMQNAIMPTDMEAEAVARRALAENTTLASLVELGKPDISTDEDDSARRQITWDASAAKIPGLTFHITVSVRDAQVVARHMEAKVDDSHKYKKPSLPAWLGGSYGTFLTFGCFYAIIRYAKRTLQKEVSHLRTLVVAALFAISYSIVAYAGLIDQVASRINGQIFLKIGVFGYVTGFLGCAFAGLLVGIAYGSGEGELREAYPGKLTSLDALLAGRIFSSDVARSVLFGAAAAAWLLLCHQAIGSFFNTDILATRSDVLSYTFARLPWLTLVLGRQYDSILIAVSGLLLPASFLLRRKMRKVRRFAWLILFAICSVMQDASKYPTNASALLAIVILVCALLLPFFAFDLLAASVSLSTLSFVEELARLNAVFPSWAPFAHFAVLLTALAILLALWLAFHGHRVLEEDVRPLYAKNLAERMSLQAEVLAAREAQLRLLPQSAPLLPGIQFAACCLPARGVGGDFYDFFRLDANRVGIFVAQGGDQGLASALCIALAKGVLMHASLQPNSPTQTIINLETSLSELLEGGSAGRLSFAYAIIDPLRNLLTYARLGDFPRIVINRSAAAAPLERVVQIPGRLATAVPIREGLIHTHPGDFLIFFTKGVTTLRARRFARGEYRWLDVLLPFLGRTAEPLQTSLLSALSKHQDRASDDLTAVVLQVTKAESSLQEVVA